ncbi:MAG: hypothetical protein KAX49_20185 [Halanaerobiales bacterium]|nr:hypothetical protein [Halanaerobiales bacterium]
MKDYKFLFFLSIILVAMIITGCASAETDKFNPIVKELSVSEGRELFDLGDDYTIFFYGVANIAPEEDKLIPIVIYAEDFLSLTAYISIIYCNQLYINEIPWLSFYGSKINKIYLEKVLDYKYPQLIVEYCAGAVGTQGWVERSFLVIISWIDNYFKKIFEHPLLIEKHYTYDTSVTIYTYEFISKGNVKSILLKDQNGLEEKYIWEKGEFIKK